MGNMDLLSLLILYKQINFGLDVSKSDVSEEQTVANEYERT